MYMANGNEKEYPPAMREIGVPEEMSPEAAADSPLVEVRQPLHFGEMREIDQPLQLEDIREQRLEDMR